MKEYLKKIDICKALMVAYHLLFLGGSTTLINGYVEEMGKLRVEIVKQVDRADKAVTKVDDTTKKLTKEINKVTKACKRIF